MHIPGKRINRNLRRESRHRWTRARIAKAYAETLKAGTIEQAMKLAALIGVTAPMPQNNQRQRRKARRQLFAAGARRHVAFA